MELLYDILETVSKLDSLYEKLIRGNKNIGEELNSLIEQMMNYTDKLDNLDFEKKELALRAITIFNSKVELINDLLKQDIFKPSSIDIQVLRDTMDSLEVRRYELVNKYVLGKIIKEELDDFERELTAFKARVYEIVPEDDKMLLEIAKMKSKIQHLNTELLEDEEVLKVAYMNSN
jgi:uncharacterized protein with HEPN domain